ncbi:myosin-13-like isoform X1 [Thunnus albacares]|uniref:myosin-13-like isoform X1 n=1 Tax=Thunnus albacares TaxID=8236 RepID=UPI001CF6139D|nr:myosin-13-like isoform X1 [Thunnus albacares]
MEKTMKKTMRKSMEKSMKKPMEQPMIEGKKEEVVPVKILEWQVDRQLSLHEKDRKFWLNEVEAKSKRIDVLEAKVSALEKELATSNKDRDEFEEQLKITQKHVKALLKNATVTDEKNKHEEKRLNKSLAGLQKQLTVTRERYEKTIKDLTEQHEKREASMQAKFQKRQALYEDETNRKMQEDMEKHQSEVENLKDANNKCEREIKQLNQLLDVIDKRHEEAFQKQEDRQQKETETVKAKHFKDCIALKVKIMSLVEKIKELENREDLTRKLNAAHEAIQNSKYIIKKKNQEIERLISEKKEAQENFSSERDNNAVLQATLNDLQEKHDSLKTMLTYEQTMLKDTREDLNGARQKNRILNDQNQLLRYKVAAHEPQLEKTKFTTKDLQTYQLRFKEDLQACLPFLDKPKKLRNRVILLKRCYLDGDDRLPMDENTRLAYQHQIDCLKKKLASTLEVNKALSNEVRNREMRIQSNAKTAHEERAALIGHINKMVEKHKPQKAKSTSNLGCVPVKLPPIKKPHPPTEQQQHFLSSELRRLSS